HSFPMTVLLAVGTLLSEDEARYLFIGLGLMLSGALMIPLINCYEKMADERERRDALVVHDECIAPPVCDAIAGEQKVEVPDWKDYFARDKTFES
ncbi:hypothetical protein PFISCL1PPCAC_25618, partial [Pristionchus fissidentatus]